MRSAAAIQDLPEPGGEIIHRPCPQCGSDEFRALDSYSKDDWRVGECGQCGFVFLQNVPVYDRMVEEFAWEKMLPQENARKQQERPIASGISKVLREVRRPFRSSEAELFARLFKPGPVLDVGCGSGERVPNVFTPYGIELSKGLCDIADGRMRELGGYAVHAPATEGIDAFTDNFFTGIILRSFLEHEWQPKKLLAGAHRVLRDDGAVFIRVPNYASLNRMARGNKWCGFRYPDHVNYFTRASLVAMARDCGFEMKLLNPLKISIDDNIKAVLTKTRPANPATGEEV